MNVSNGYYLPQEAVLSFFLPWQLGMAEPDFGHSQGLRRNRALLCGAAKPYSSTS